MQLTRFDRWLRERFVYETHVYTLREPETIPAGVIVEEMPDAPGRRFRHRMIIRSEDQAQSIISRLKASNQMFTTRVVDRQEWYVPFLAPKDKSVTWWVIWAFILSIGGFFLIRGGLNLWNSPIIQDNIQDAIKTMKS